MERTPNLLPGLERALEIVDERIKAIKDDQAVTARQRGPMLLAAEEIRSSIAARVITQRRAPKRRAKA